MVIAIGVDAGYGGMDICGLDFFAFVNFFVDVNNK